MLNPLLAKHKTKIDDFGSRIERQFRRRYFDSTRRNTLKTDPFLARKVALSCRILAKLGMFKETTGHVSARLGNAHMLIRGRGPKETGSAFHQVGESSSPISTAAIRTKKPDSSRPTKRSSTAKCIRRDRMRRGRPRPSALRGALQYGRHRAPADFRWLRSQQYAAGLERHSRVSAHVDLEYLGAGSRHAKSDGRQGYLHLRGHGLIVVGPSVEQATLTAIKWTPWQR